MIRLFGLQFRRDWIAQIRARDGLVNPLAFLFLAITAFAIALGGKPDRLAESAPGILWSLLLLANLLSLDSLFRRDHEDGVLEQMLLQAESGFVAVLAKAAVHCCGPVLLLVGLAPVAGLMLGLPPAGLPWLLLGLLLGAPALSLIGAVGAALTVGLGNGGLLLALLLLPLQAPVLIFGVSALDQALAGVTPAAQLYWLAAISAGALTLAPFAAAAALKISVEES